MFYGLIASRCMHALDTLFVHPFTCYTLASLLCLIALWFLCASRGVSRVASSDPLQALLSIITPRCSLWPSQYMSLARRRSSSTLQVPLKLIIQDIIAGRVELRSPQDTLERIISGKGQLQIEAWRVFLSYGSLRLVIIYRWCVSTLFPGLYLPLRLVPIPDVVGSQRPGMVTSEKQFRQSPSQSPDTSLNHSNRVLRFSNRVIDSSSVSISEPISVLPVLLSTFGSHVLRKIAIATTLDTTPHAHLETALLALQSSIPAGHLALLEFTSIESAPSIWSSAWLLSALPCFYRVSDCSKPCQRLMPVPPLRNGLSRVITLLESGPQSCVILSVQNVSTPQAQLLNDHAGMLDGRAGRQRFLAAFSDLDRDLALRAWRAEMFLARWEAACYACGSLGRWVICMKRPLS